jgi:hypothetical protein
MARTDSALLADDDDPIEALVRAVVSSVSTEIDVTAGGVTLHLAAWEDTDHWAGDWTAKGIDDPQAFIAGLVAPYERSAT